MINLTHVTYGDKFGVAGVDSPKVSFAICGDATDLKEAAAFVELVKALSVGGGASAQSESVIDNFVAEMSGLIQKLSRKQSG